MRHDIYEAMKARISVVDRKLVCEQDGVEEWQLPEGAIFYYFSNEGLNEGLDFYDENFIDAIRHGMMTKNMWNVCQRFYGFLRRWREDFDERLLANTPKVTL